MNAMKLILSEIYETFKNVNFNVLNQVANFWFSSTFRNLFLSESGEIIRQIRHFLWQIGIASRTGNTVQSMAHKIDATVEILLSRAVEIKGSPRKGQIQRPKQIMFFFRVSKCIFGSVLCQISWDLGDFCKSPEIETQILIIAE